LLSSRGSVIRHYKTLTVKETQAVPQPPDSMQAADPADRLEAALNRIAYALDRPQPAIPAEPDPHAPDLQALGANIDALCARIRDMLGPDDAPASTEG